MTDYSRGYDKGRSDAYAELTEALPSPWQWRRLLKRLPRGQRIMVHASEDGTFSCLRQLGRETLDAANAYDPDTALRRVLERLPARSEEAAAPPEKLTGDGWQILTGDREQG